MNELMQMPNHIYTVELRFYGNGLKPSEVTQRLFLEPTSSSDNLTLSLKGRKINSFLAYSGQDKDGFHSEWQSLEEGLDFLLQKIASRKAAIIDLSRDFEGIWWCGHFQASFDGGPTLSPKILTEISSYGLPFFIDNYFLKELKRAHTSKCGPCNE
jgi:hypothetical protein